MISGMESKVACHSQVAFVILSPIFFRSTALNKTLPIKRRRGIWSLGQSRSPRSVVILTQLTIPPVTIGMLRDDRIPHFVRDSRSTSAYRGRSSTAFTETTSRSSTILPKIQGKSAFGRSVCNGRAGTPSAKTA